MLHYIAGFIDGEGSIICAKNQNTIIVRVQATNTDRAPLDVICAAAGGAVHGPYGKSAHYKRHKEYYQWIVSRRGDTMRILKQLQKALITKRKVCAMAIRILQLQAIGTHASMLRAREIGAQMRILNKRGL